MTKLEKLEMEALSYAEVSALPEPVNDATSMWIFAIAKVLTRSNTYSYVIVRNKRSGDPVVIKAFDTSSIARFLEIYPYKMLSSEYVPSFKTLKEAKKYLAEVLGVCYEKVEPLTKDEVLDTIFGLSVDKQLYDEEKVKSYAAKREREQRERMEAEKALEEQTIEEQVQENE